MRAFSYYVHNYWLSGILVAGAIWAVFYVYRNWDKIMIKGSGRK